MVPGRDYCRHMWGYDHYPLVRAPRRVGWTASLYAPYARYGTFQRWERVYASGTCRGLSRDCVRLHRYTLAGVRARWSPCLRAPGTGRSQARSRLWGAALLCLVCGSPRGGSYAVRGVRAPCARVAAGPAGPSPRGWRDGRISVASPCAYGDLSIGLGLGLTRHREGKACPRAM